MMKLLLQRLKNRPDSEHEAALIRITIVSVVITYFTIAARVDRIITDLEQQSLLMIFLFLFISLGIFLCILISPGVSILRRIFAMAIDVGITTYFLYLLDDVTTPLFGLYLWVTFGNGFRYGVRYLYLSGAMSVSGFTLVLATSEYWAEHRTLGIGLLITLIVLPMYVSSLLRQLHAALDRAKDASRAKSQFLANMSHEIRTPLNGVIGMSHLLMGTSLQPEQKDYAQTIYASARTLLTLIEDILDISKIESGKLVLDNTNFDLHGLVNSIGTMLAPQAHTKNLAFHVHITPETPYLLRGDPLHMRQVLINLVGNAIKFTEHGEIDIRVRLLGEDPLTASASYTKA